MSAVSRELVPCQEYPNPLWTRAGKELGEPKRLGRVFPGAAKAPDHALLSAPPPRSAPLFPACYRDLLPGSDCLARRMRIWPGVRSVRLPDGAAPGARGRCCNGGGI